MLSKRNLLMVTSGNQKNHEKGQGLYEFALILVFTAFIVIAAMKILGPIIGNVFSHIGSPLGDQYAATATDTPVSIFTPTMTPTPTLTPTPTSSPTPTWIYCATENQFCSFSGTAEVKYGAVNTWVTRTFTNGVLCANSVFGDPLYGTVKSCSYSQ
jgi:Flp pilus assembly pilin Flp